ncbi:uncharacterized protein EDB93DRAFT_1325942, partial [Suillus bovinus]|uniref:uncharacterized protein n=1 Tax=Suillus bovinus TaxID=48563 RepID=UPI001B871867
LSCAIALLFSLSSAAAAITNAQRLARGLPPLPPKFGRALPGYAKTPTEAGGNPVPSSAPYKTFTGRILVKGHNGKRLGHLYNRASGINGVNFGASSEDLHVSFTTSRSQNGLIDLQIVDSTLPGPDYIGTTSNGALTSGSSKAVSFGKVTKTPAHSHHSHESAIWTYDSRTHQLKVHYVNPNGHEAKTTIAYQNNDNKIFFVSDIGAYNAAQTNPDHHVSPITFYLD